MKIAVVLSGYFGTISRGESHNGRETAKRLKMYFNGHDVDYYIHSWQVDAKDEIINIYNPKESLFEHQIDFNQIATDNNIQQAWFDENFNRASTMYSRATIHNSLSFFNSRSKALKLIHNDENYDWVFVMRLDVGHVGPSDVNFPTKFNFDDDRNKIYTPYWNQLNIGLGDMWTVMNLKHANILSNIYDKVLSYYSPNSNYIHDMLNGWPLSDKTNEFSNICLTDRKPPLMTYPKWYRLRVRPVKDYKNEFINIQ
jgi:hypothetical protein